MFFLLVIVVVEGNIGGEINKGNKIFLFFGFSLANIFLYWI
jgi:hypothetical protein